MAKRVAELAVLLQWRPGDIVADIGAGKGKLTVFTAERIGPSGRVYGTEMDREKFAALQELAGSHTNITTIKASDSDTNLPDLSCDSILHAPGVSPFRQAKRYGLKSVSIAKT